MKLRIWWKAWHELVLRFLTFAASLASLAGLLIAFLPSPRSLPWWAIALLVLSLLFFFVFVVLEFVTRQGHRVYAKSDTKGIREYMHKWIQHGGRVAIWTRDMTWADNDDTRDLLKKKASRNELILCLPKQNDLAKELADAGAEVCAYGAGRLESPTSRFTIIYFGRDGARVAVGRPDGDTHVIDEFDASSQPAFSLAADLVALARGQHADRQGK